MPQIPRCPLFQANVAAGNTTRICSFFWNLCSSFLCKVQQRRTKCRLPRARRLKCSPWWWNIHSQVFLLPPTCRFRALLFHSFHLLLLFVLFVVTLPRNGRRKLAFRPLCRRWPPGSAMPVSVLAMQATIIGLFVFS